MFEYFRALNMPRIKNMSLVTLIFEMEPFLLTWWPYFILGTCNFEQAVISWDFIS